MAAILTVAFLIGIAKPTPAFAGTGTVTTAPVPAGATSSSDFSVSANGQSAGVYGAGSNAWGNTASFSEFDFANGSVTVSIIVNFSFSSYKLVPNSLGLASTRSGNTVTYTLSQPTNVSLVLDGDYHARVLHVFAQAPDPTPVSPTDPNVIYFGPGFFDRSAGAPLQVPSGKTLYLAQGAVLRARVLISGASGSAVRGHGVLLDDYSVSDAYDNVALAIKQSTNITVDGIIANRIGKNWTAFMSNSSGVNVTNYHAVSPVYASSDGFDIISSHDVTFNNVFIHSCDDAVSVKGLPASSYDLQANPALYEPVYNINYKNSQLWADDNNGMVVGEESIASSFSNIHFDNIDVIYNNDDYYYPDVLTDRAAIEVFQLNATQMSGITFNNIRVDQAKRLINVDIDNNFFLNTLRGNQGWPGSISGVTFSNITSTSTGSNQIRMYGWDASHQVSNIALNNVKINGQLVSSFSDPHLSINSLVSGTTITANGSTVNQPTRAISVPAGTDWSPNVYDLSHDLTPELNNQGWSYQTWVAGVGFAPMTWNASTQRWTGRNTYDQVWDGKGQVYVSPDQDQVLMNWTAPKAGTVDVTGTVRKFDASGGDGVRVSIWQNSNQIWGWQQVAYNDSVGYSPSFTLNVAQGDVVSFRLDPGSNSSYDTSSWSPRVTYIPVGSFDLSDDLTSIQNTQGWSFQTWVAGVGFAPMNWSTSIGRWAGRATYDQLWNGGAQVFVSPDHDQVMMNWTAPKAGTINVSGTVAKFDLGGGDGVAVSIWQNSNNVWGWQHIAYNDNVGYNPSLTLGVAQGDVISFRIDSGSDSSYDTSSWSPRIIYQ